MDRIRIESFQDLLLFIDEKKLSPDQIQEICETAKLVWFINDMTKEELISELQSFWDKYQSNRERPLFIDNQ